MARGLAPVVLRSDPEYFATASQPNGGKPGFALTGVLMAIGGAAATFLVHPERDEAKLNTHLQENVQ